MFAKIVLVLGILGVVLGFLIAAVSVALPELTSNRVNMEEAMIGIILGVLLLIISFLVAVAGLIFVIIGRKSKN